MADEMKKGVTIVGKDDKSSTVVKEKEFSEKETTNQMMVNEDDIIHGLVDAAGFSNDNEQTTTINIARPVGKTGNTKVLFKFRVRALSEKEYTECKKRSTKYIRNKRIGMTLPDETDSSKYRADLIYTATVPDDRKKLWDNHEVWDALRNNGKDIVKPLDVIEECLKAGEKDRVIDVIDKLSGYSDNEYEQVNKNMEDTIKN